MLMARLARQPWQVLGSRFHIEPKVPQRVGGKLHLQTTSKSAARQRPRRARGRGMQGMTERARLSCIVLLPQLARGRRVCKCARTGQRRDHTHLATPARAVKRIHALRIKLHDVQSTTFHDADRSHVAWPSVHNQAHTHGYIGAATVSPATCQERESGCVQRWIEWACSAPRAHAITQFSRTFVRSPVHHACAPHVPDGDVRPSGKQRQRCQALLVLYRQYERGGAQRVAGICKPTKAQQQ